MKRNAKDLKLLGKKVQLAGHTFYAFQTLDMIPQLRLETYLARNFEYDNLRVTLPRLLAFTETVAELGNQARFMDVQQLNGYLNNLLQKPITQNTMLYMASPLVIIDDEPIDQVDNEYDKLKYSLGAKDDKIRSFFLAVLLALNKNLQDLSKHGKPLDFSNPKQMIVEQLFNQMITGI